MQIILLIISSRSAKVEKWGSVCSVEYYLSHHVQVGLTWGIVPMIYDFTDDINQYYGTDGAKEIESGIWAMWCGDTNSDTRINDADKVLANNIAVYEEYHDADLNFDGNVTNADKFLVNANKVTSPQTQVP